jgi:hypothetical protein
MQPGSGGWTAVTSVALDAAAGHGSDNPLAIHFAHPVVSAVRDEQIAAGVER